jgi:ketosteroid isomerase-like protein
MPRRFLLLIVLIAMGTTITFGSARFMQADPIIALERGALDRWGRGDPHGYLELYARDVTYFDPARDGRVDGLDAMTALLAPIKGQVKVDRYEMIAPHVYRAGDAAVLTYNLVSHSRRPDGAATVTRWNSTAVYAQIGGQWKIVHSHWSYTKPELKAPNRP